MTPEQASQLLAFWPGFSTTVIVIAAVLATVGLLLVVVAVEKMR